MVHASTAPLGGSYHCLACGARLTVVRSTAPPRFLHAPGSACDERHVERLAAARLLRARLAAELTTDGTVRLAARCGGSGGGTPCPEHATVAWRLELLGWRSVVAGPACPSPFHVAVLGGQPPQHPGSSATCEPSGELLLAFELVELVERHAAGAEPGPRGRSDARRHAQAPDRADVHAHAHADSGQPHASRGRNVAFRLDVQDVLRFRQLCPLEAPEPAARCEACKRRSASEAIAADPPSGPFLDAGFVREAARVQGLWDVVLDAAEAASPPRRRATAHGSNRDSRENRSW